MYEAFLSAQSKREEELNDNISVGSGHCQSRVNTSVVVWACGCIHICACLFIYKHEYESARNEARLLVDIETMYIQYMKLIL